MPLDIASDIIFNTPNLQPVLNKVRAELGDIPTNIRVNFDVTGSRNISTTNTRLKSLITTLERLPPSAEKATDSLRRFFTTFNIASNIGGRTGFTNINRNFKTLENQVDRASGRIQNFGDRLALTVERFGAFAIVSTAIFAFVGSISTGTAAAVDFEKQLVRVSQVTGKTLSQLSGLTEEITRLAAGFGVSGEELLQASVTLSQAGFSADDTRKALETLAKTDLSPTFDSIEQSTEGLIAVFNQFQLGIDDVDAAFGSINQVAAQFAVESSDLIDAVRIAGGVFAQSSAGIREGNDALAEFLGLITAVRQTTRQSGNQIATALRTVIPRLQRTRTRDFLQENFGIDLLDAGKFVGPFEALRKISEVVQNLPEGDPRIAQIIEQIAGIRQFARVLPILQNFNLALDAQQEALRGTASLSIDAATAQQSLSNELVKTREEFLDLFRDIVGSDAFQILARGAIEFAQALIRVADAAAEVLPILGLLLGVRAIRGIGRLTGNALTLPAVFAQKGGIIPRLAAGGALVPGIGVGDRIPAMLEPGEFILNKKAVKAIGVENLFNLNDKVFPRFQTGGFVGKQTGGIIHAQTGIEIPESLRFTEGTQELRDALKRATAGLEGLGKSTSSIRTSLGNLLRTIVGNEEGAREGARRVNRFLERQLGRTDLPAGHLERQIRIKEETAGLTVERGPGGIVRQRRNIASQREQERNLLLEDQIRVQRQIVREETVSLERIKTQNRIREDSLRDLRLGRGGLAPLSGPAITDDSIRAARLRDLQTRRFQRQIERSQRQREFLDFPPQLQEDDFITQRRRRLGARERAGFNRRIRFLGGQPFDFINVGEDTALATQQQQQQRPSFLQRQRNRFTNFRRRGVGRFVPQFNAQNLALTGLLLSSQLPEPRSRFAAGAQGALQGALTGGVVGSLFNPLTAAVAAVVIGFKSLEGSLKDFDAQVSALNVKRQLQFLDRLPERERFSRIGEAEGIARRSALRDAEFVRPIESRFLDFVRGNVLGADLEKEREDRITVNAQRSIDETAAVREAATNEIRQLIRSGRTEEISDRTNLLRGLITGSQELQKEFQKGRIPFAKINEEATKLVNRIIQEEKQRQGQIDSLLRLNLSLEKVTQSARLVEASLTALGETQRDFDIRGNQILGQAQGQFTLPEVNFRNIFESIDLATPNQIRQGARQFGVSRGFNTDLLEFRASSDDFNRRLLERAQREPQLDARQAIDDEIERGIFSGFGEEFRRILNDSLRQIEGLDAPVDPETGTATGIKLQDFIVSTEGDVAAQFEKITKAGDLLAEKFAELVNATEDSFNRFRENLNKATDLLVTVGELEVSQLAARQNQANLLRQALGQEIPTGELIRQQEDLIRQQTRFRDPLSGQTFGGSADPTELVRREAAIQGRIRQIQQGRDPTLAQIRDPLERRIAGEEAISQLNRELIENRNALQGLTQEIVGLEAIQNELARIQSRREGARNEITRIFGSSIDELRQQSREISAFNLFKQGGLNALGGTTLTRGDVVAGFEQRRRILELNPNTTPEQLEQFDLDFIRQIERNGLPIPKDLILALTQRGQTQREQELIKLQTDAVERQIKATEALTEIIRENARNFVANARGGLRQEIGEIGSGAAALQETNPDQLLIQSQEKLVQSNILLTQSLNELAGRVGGIGPDGVRLPPPLLRKLAQNQPIELPPFTPVERLPFPQQTIIPVNLIESIPIDLTKATIDALCNCKRMDELDRQQQRTTPGGPIPPAGVPPQRIPPQRIPPQQPPGAGRPPSRREQHEEERRRRREQFENERRRRREEFEQRRRSSPFNRDFNQTGRRRQEFLRSPEFQENQRRGRERREQRRQELIDKIIDIDRKISGPIAKRSSTLETLEGARRFFASELNALEDPRLRSRINEEDRMDAAVVQITKAMDRHQIRLNQAIENEISRLGHIPLDTTDVLSQRLLNALPPDLNRADQIDSLLRRIQEGRVSVDNVNLNQMREQLKAERAEITERFRARGPVGGGGVFNVPDAPIRTQDINFGPLTTALNTNVSAVNNLAQTISSLNINFGGDFNLAFLDNINRLQNVFESLQIPTRIEMSAKHEVNVNLNGAQVLSSLKPELANMITNSIREVFRNQFTPGNERLDNFDTVPLFSQGGNN